MKRRLNLFFVLVACMSQCIYAAPAPQVLSDDTQYLLVEARELFDAGNYKQVEQLIAEEKESWAHKPYDQSLVKLLLAQALLKQGGYARANELLQQIDELGVLTDQQSDIVKQLRLQIAHDTGDYEGVIATLSAQPIASPQDVTLLANAYYRLSRCDALSRFLQANTQPIKVDNELLFRGKCIKEGKQADAFNRWIGSTFTSGKLTSAHLSTARDLLIESEFYLQALSVQQTILQAKPAQDERDYELTYKLYFKSHLYYEAAKYWLSLIRSGVVSIEDESYLNVVKPLFLIDHEDALFFIFANEQLVYNTYVKTEMMRWFYQKHQWEAVVRLHETGMSLASLRLYGEITTFTAIAYYHLGRSEEAYEMFEEAKNYPTVAELATQWLKFMDELTINGVPNS